MHASLSSLTNGWAPAGSSQRESLDALRNQMRSVLRSCSLGLANGATSPVLGHFDFRLTFTPVPLVTTDENRDFLSILRQAQTDPRIDFDDSFNGRTVPTGFEYSFPSGLDLFGRRFRRLIPMPNSSGSGSGMRNSFISYSADSLNPASTVPGQQGKIRF